MSDRPKLPLNVETNEFKDTVSICGVLYSGDLFREFGMGPQPGRLFRILEAEPGGIITVKTYPVDIEKFEAWCDEMEAECLRKLAAE